jgi:nucleoside-diphosphate-sugar epimerase
VTEVASASRGLKHGAGRHALVTGATGLVGSHLVERLGALGWTVRALVRDPRAAAWLGELGVADLARGDVLDEVSFGAAARGCDIVFHAAAAVTPARGDWESYRVPNVEGTRTAIAVARASGARLMHVSSVAVYGPKGRFRAEGPTVESVPLEPLPEGAYYARSKRESEQLVLDAHARGEIWATAVRPDVVYGRRDRQFVPRFAAIFSTLHAMPLPSGGRNTLAIIHAGNVADCAIRAATSAIGGGKAYNVTNEGDVTLSQFVRLAAAGLGTRVVGVPMPLPVLQGGLTAAKAVARWLHLPGAAVLQHATLGFVARDNPFSSELAQRELGWTPVVAPTTGIPDAFRWWKTNH